MFSFIGTIFDVTLYRPLFNSLVFIYNYIPGHDFGIAIIVLTLLIRVILYPLSVKALNSQRALQKLQPKLQEIQKKYKDDKEKQGMETLELYRKEKINPFSGLFLALIQFPILIALYQVFWRGLNTSELTRLYSFVINPVYVNPTFLHWIHLSKPHIAVATLAAILQFVQTKMLLPNKVKAPGEGPDVSEIMQKQMVYIFPFVTVIILMKLPAALGMYWIVSGIFSIIQQYIFLKKEKV